VWQFLFGDRLMVGFIRLALVAIVLYLIASVPALAVAGRWVKGFGASGLATDDAQATDRSLKLLQQQVTDLERELAAATVQIGSLTTERDRARALADRLHEALTSAEGGRRNPPG
jgi:peptidoglycan hydrolase CwlO-like protein